MRNKFDLQLEELNNDLILMGALCETAIAEAMTALTMNDAAAADRAQALERELDHKERDIETQCLKLLLQQQPVAKDLRLVSAALKMITDMERIGDQAADIAAFMTARDLSKAVHGLGGASANSGHLVAMAEAAIRMVNESVDAFVRKDVELAMRVMDSDDVVDGLFNEVKHDIIQLLIDNTAHSEEAIDLLMIAKYLERIGDHAVNIAEWVVFSVTGNHKSEKRCL